MTLDDWFDTYRPIANPTGDSGFEVDGVSYMFETYGDDLKKVEAACQSTPKRVWTLVDGDDGELYVSSGFHYVNRLGYFLTEVDYDGEPVAFPYVD